MSAQLLVILVTCTGQSSAQAQDTVPRFQVETKSGVAAIAETLADLELKLGSSFLQADEAVIAQNLVLGGLEETIHSISNTVFCCLSCIIAMVPKKSPTVDI